MGGTSSGLQLFQRRVTRFLKRPRRAKLLTDQAEEFRRCFGDGVAPQYKLILERFLTVRGNLWTRLSYNAAMDVRRQTWMDTAILRTMILIGRV
jgi:hypothetical protein